MKHIIPIQAIRFQYDKSIIKPEVLSGKDKVYAVIAIGNNELTFYCKSVALGRKTYIIEPLPECTTNDIVEYYEKDIEDTPQNDSYGVGFIPRG